MKIIEDCGECENCETVTNAQSSDERYHIYCSDHRTVPENRTIWSSPEYLKIMPYPNFTIPKWCPLPEVPHNKSFKMDGLKQCNCEDNWCYNDLCDDCRAVRG